MPVYVTRTSAADKSQGVRPKQGKPSRSPSKSDYDDCFSQVTDVGSQSASFQSSFCGLVDYKKSGYSHSYSSKESVQIDILAKLITFLPTHDPQVLKETLVACDWDLNKTAMFLLESATTKTAYQQSEVKDGPAIKCVF